MIYIKNTTGTISLLLLCSLLFTANLPGILYAEEIEETADIKFYSDNIVIGEMDEYSKNSLTVNNSRYDYCKKVIAFSPMGTRIAIDDIDAAETVKLFIKNYACVRKIHVLRFAE